MITLAQTGWQFEKWANHTTLHPIGIAAAGLVDIGSLWKQKSCCRWILPSPFLRLDLAEGRNRWHGLFLRSDPRDRRGGSRLDARRALELPFSVARWTYSGLCSDNGDRDYRQNRRRGNHKSPGILT